MRGTFCARSCWRSSPWLAKHTVQRSVNDVDWGRLALGKEGLGITLGIDIGKHDLWPVVRWDSAAGLNVPGE